MNPKVRIWVSCLVSPWFAVYELAKPVEKLVLADFDGGFPQQGFQTEGRKFTHSVRKQGYSNTEWFYFRNSFVDAAGESSLLQRESKA